MKLYFGYADEDSELSIYENYLDINKNLHTINQVITLDELLNLQYLCDQVTIHNELVKSVNNLIRNTRTHHDIILGASTRSGIALIKCLKAFALIKGRTYVIEDDLLAITSHVLHHRLLFKHKEGKLNALPSIINQEIKRLSKLRLQ
jgi:MoxR-like ATPase